MKNRDGGQGRGGGGEGNFQGHGSLSGHSCLWDACATYTNTQTCIQLTPVDTMAAGHTALVYVCVCVCLALTGHTVCTNAPVLPQPVIWLSSKPATTGDDNSMLLSRYYPTSHPVTVYRKRRGGGWEPEPYCVKLLPLSLFLIFLFFFHSLVLSVSIFPGLSLNV